MKTAKRRRKKDFAGKKKNGTKRSGSVGFLFAFANFPIVTTHWKRDKLCEMHTNTHTYTLDA